MLIALYLGLLLGGLRLLDLHLLDLGVLHFDCVRRWVTASLLHQFHELLALLHTEGHVGLGRRQGLGVGLGGSFVAHTEVLLLVALALLVEHFK